MSSKRLETAKKYISMFATLDTTLLSSVLADSAAHTFAPASLGMSREPLDKSTFVHHISSLREIMTGFPVYAKQYIESESSNSVVVWATSKTQFREDVKDEGEGVDWDYEGEYVFMFWMDESGEKIVRTVEFLDSLKTEGLRGVMKRARANREKRLGKEGKA
ncbi:hypothetical protein BU26DRAFT_513866 [Trematosphaeria pertusa]|uniref:SnoaL-like domain-containing protein n=1 Tax=Trematosphaeria pertusa TaxID=390896 RepID=A0A6A6J6N9_9PLEO|nr:uncharacterized protein BU26DRAFT_513866 [Trematosphaeria pertusa]KAF2257163.1 hypothetical protein BU26DRAFT_513866 [Trematosphaeria pertusa]